MKSFIFGLGGHLGSYLIEELVKNLKENQETNIKIDGSYRSTPYQTYDLNALGSSLFFEWPNPKNQIPDLNSYHQIAFLLTPIPDYQELISKVLQQSRAHIFFISSTSVFSDGQVDGQSERSPITENGKKLSEIEKALENESQKNSRPITIIRPSGLIDERRHPKNFFKNTNRIPNPEWPINFVHTEDVARFLLHSMKNSIQGSYNLVSQDVISKKKFYQAVGNLAALQTDTSSTKRSKNQKFLVKKEKKVIDTQTALTGFEYRYPYLMDEFKNN